MKSTIDFDVPLVRELFDYADGSLIWRRRPESHFSSKGQCKAWNSKFHGKIAGVVAENGYVLIGVTIDGVERKYKAHRIVWAWHTGVWPENEIDHEDHDQGNNRIENLRDASHQQNGRNLPISSANTSGATGVTWHKRAGRWLAQITVCGRNRYIGLFDTVDLASAAYQLEAAKAGFHPNHGKRTGAYQKGSALLQQRNERGVAA